MTPEIALVLGILIAAMVLFITEIIRMDVVALMVLCTLALTGLVGYNEVLSGFSNPAVVTVWAMFILSGGLTITGVANIIGRQVLRLAGNSEARVVTVIMLTSGFMSAIMNNIGVAALLLPVVMDISRRTGKPPSRLLMPLAYGSLLGGLTTLIGTPPNLLASEALKIRGLEPFKLFDYTPVGLTAMLAGVAFIALIGRRFLPVNDPEKDTKKRAGKDLQQQYGLHERLFVMRVPANSIMNGKSLLETRLGSAAGLTVFAVIRSEQTHLAPDPGMILRAGDGLLVGGKLDRFHELNGWRELEVVREDVKLDRMVSQRVGLGELRLASPNGLEGQNLVQANFRGRFGVNILSIRRDSQIIRSNLAVVALHAGDRLLAHGERDRLRALPEKAEFEDYEPISERGLREIYRFQDWIFEVDVPLKSVLIGKTLAESRLGDAFGLQVVDIARESGSQLAPAPDITFRQGDRLIIKGKREDLDTLRGLQELEMEREATPYLGVLESQRGGLMEVILSPRTRLAGKTPRDLHFREKYGLQLMAVWRQGRARYSDLRDFDLQFGDALLLLGPPSKIQELGADPDFIVLTESAQQVAKPGKAPLAALIMAVVLVPVLLGWLPISISAVAGVTLMILTRCMSMEDAYRHIEWRPIFLIAGMLPLGTAMQDSGAANFVAEKMVDLVGFMGPWGVIVGLYLITTLATTVVPTAALIVLMAPIVIKTAADMDLSPHALMMAVAMAASASFTSPISHPANVLVMGPGGYRFVDYFKLGVPLTIVVMIVVLCVLPIFWPL